MARFWNRWTGRSKTSQSTHKKRDKTRKSPRRRLKSETLETRQLLAANLFHNELIPEDTNEDGVVSAIDALTIINEINRQTRGGDVATGDGGQVEDRGRGRMTDVNNDGRDTALDALMVINRLHRERNGGFNPVQKPETPNEDPTGDLGTEVRSVDGTGNNLETPELGSADTALIRIAENDYADGISEPAGEDRPSAREISNTVSAAAPDGTTNERDLSSFVFIWGQFLDHDIDLSLQPANEADEIAFDIEVPTGDPLFDPAGTGEETIHLTRSDIAEGTGTSIDTPAEQVNAITAWVDGSQVYGSTQTVADSLREFEGGRMLMSDDGLLPTDDNGNVLAGDIRASENIALTSMHALFIREHNRLADEISAANPDLTDEEIYQQAREIVIAELQSITYNEFLPALLGEDALAEYEGYDSSVDPSIANEFSTAAFRFGHTTLNDTIGFYGNDGLDVEDAISLADAFFNSSLLEETGIDSILKSGASTLSQETDLEVVDSLRNFLFGQPGSGGFDLVSLNIQRGRDHGLADFNSVREAIGLEAYDSFDQITSDVELQGKLETLYGDVNNIDLWVGLLAEDHAEGSSLGETSTLIIADQFERLRDGDRFYYENTMTSSEIREIENTTLADIIERNTTNTSLQSNVFFFTPTIAGTVTTDTPVVEQVANQQRGRQDRGNDRRSRGSNDIRQSTVGVEGVTLELLDSEGDVVDTVITNSDGNYEFDSFDRSGEYQVRVASSNEITSVNSDSIDLLVSSGDSHLKNVDFSVMV
ncbi:peroxidase [Novipirellula galeiformis]|uniref:Peroxidase n=1 Tax=Novipirellula galeiformis TaxID=2528004 RepID=A0A5C6CG35_9BACT|nr:peroxidase family protein [Novipirellula galeiformis]TWU23268.1 peroxidase [Novipirellula galeiformis]